MKLTVYRDKCRHFTGIQHETCSAGVRYKDRAISIRSSPCLATSAGSISDTCPEQSLLSQEEHAAFYAELEAKVAEMTGRIDAGKCHVCEAPIEPSSVIGRCKYASCGHRLGQVGAEGGE